MQLIEKFEYKQLSRVTNDDGTRFYKCPVYNIDVPSVTTILSATSDMTSLLLWEEAVGKQRANKVKLEACNLGTLMHTNLENHVQGLGHMPGSHPLRVQAAKMANVIIEKSFHKINEVWGMEVGMYFPGNYAGTTDLIGVYDGKSAIIDYKTTKKMKSIGDISNYLAQLSAYAMASDEVYGTKIESAVILMVSRDLKFKEFVLDLKELEKYKIIFLERFATYLSFS